MRKFESIHIDSATPQQLREYAKTFLGIPVDEDDDGAVLAKVRAANEGETIFINSAHHGEQPASQAGQAPLQTEENKGGGIVGTLGRNDPKVQLTLHAEERDGVVVNRHKEVGVNGVVWLLKRGMSITIPYRVFEALENAERHVITHTGDGEVREQVVKNTPYNIEKMPSPEEIAEWHARTDSLFVP